MFENSRVFGQHRNNLRLKGGGGRGMREMKGSDQRIIICSLCFNIEVYVYSIITIGESEQGKFKFVAALFYFCFRL